MEAMSGTTQPSAIQQQHGHLSLAGCVHNYARGRGISERTAQPICAGQPGPLRAADKKTHEHFHFFAK